MNQQPVIGIPPAFRTWMIQAHGSAGAAWIDSIHRKFQDLAAMWNLGDAHAPLHGGASLVIPVTWENQPVILKLAFDTPAYEREALSLQHWDGRGMVRLLHRDDSSNAMLLEHLGPAHLDCLPFQEAVVEIANILRTLAIEAHPRLPNVTQTAAGISEHLEHRWIVAGQPFPASLVDTCRHLIAEHADDRTMLMVNKDLHYRNVLSGRRLPWIAIDPQPYAGSPEFAIASILLRSIDNCHEPDELQRVFQTIIESASLDPGKARDWTIVRIADYWLWALENGLTEDPVRCETVLEWLGFTP